MPPEGTPPEGAPPEGTPPEASDSESEPGSSTDEIPEAGEEDLKKYNLEIMNYGLEQDHEDRDDSTMN
jgi:hypothetical protein